MKKSTIIVLLIVFLGSVLIVGIFGMQAVPYEKLVYINTIEVTDIITDDGQKVNIKYNQEGNYYFAFITYNPQRVQRTDENGNSTYEEVFEVTIVWDYLPKNATNKNIKVSIVEPAEPPCDPLTENAAAGRGDPLVFRNPGNVHLRYAAVDSATGAKLDIWLYVVVR